ncbi:MAG: protease inhibitor I9 family protein, partial [Anaerolineaceae bacterium]|nr:protease inhibitor I9 family protein [Anaerolineaceae bacterium]
MKKVVTKLLSVLLLAALLVSPVAAAAPERQAPVTDAPVLDELEQSWLDRAQAATSFTVQLVEPSLAVYGGGNAIMQNSNGKLDVDSPEAVAYLQKINDGLDSFISQAESLLGRDLEVLYRYDAVLNGFSAKMNFKEAQMLREHPDVQEVYPDEIYQLDTDVSPEFIGAEQIWDGTAVVDSTGYKGEGTIAGIIDTGINMQHPSFKASSPQDPGWTATNPYGDGVYK